VAKRSQLVERARLAGVTAIGVATLPSALAGDISGAVVVLIAGIAAFYAGAYMGVIGITAPLE
jgi:hypothetical protein